MQVEAESSGDCIFHLKQYAAAVASSDVLVIESSLDVLGYIPSVGNFVICGLCDHSVDHFVQNQPSCQNHYFEENHFLATKFAMQRQKAFLL